MTAQVLVVDEGEADRQALCAAVAALGHTVHAVASGQQALAHLARTSDVDVVLLDLVMAGPTSCTDVLRAIKSDPRLQHIPVIVVSTADHDDEIARSIELGASDHLGKPVRAPLLAARIAAGLAQKQLRDTELDHLRQVDRVIDAAESIQAGDYDVSALEPMVRRADRLGTLAGVVVQLAGEVQARESDLRRQVSNLRIEIDRSQLRRRVTEVTDSEHYRRLAEQAVELRSLIRGSGETSADGVSRPGAAPD